MELKLKRKLFRQTKNEYGIDAGTLLIHRTKASHPDESIKNNLITPHTPFL